MTLMFLLELKHAPGICFFVVVFLHSLQAPYEWKTFLYILYHVLSV